MSAITISRQMGSRGDELALHVAQKLGWRLIQRNLINQAALAAGVPHMALADIDELGLLNLRPSVKEWRAYQNQVESIIRYWADKGKTVIVGRGGQMVLRDRPEVFHVRVVASFEMRVAQLQREEIISAESACARLETSAKMRARYLRRSYGVQIDDPTLYHLTINTGLLGLSQAVNLVIQTFQGWIEADHINEESRLRPEPQRE
ncbi:MAG TPA: cytidylate kinase-like family protein [Anaerolineae bacterium]|nr:cytidylate kinase-like family protein [Anaerolineae bacterium]HXW00301.1 cytidylate kinase-like family protein [Anaerolineae bacterium]